MDCNCNANALFVFVLCVLIWIDPTGKIGFRRLDDNGNSFQDFTENRDNKTAGDRGSGDGHVEGFCRDADDAGGDCNDTDYRDGLTDEI